MESERTEISELGEFGLIAKLTKDFPRHQNSTTFGVGDDAAVIGLEDGRKLLISTDMLTEGVHFDLMYVPLKHLGYKAVTANLSDICAMNGTPSQITVSIAVSNRFPVEALEELYSGIKKACDVYKVDMIGGDTTSSKGGLVISITAVGFAKADDIAYRHQAEKGDLIVVTGDLGSAYMGLQVLERERHVFTEAPGTQPDLTGYEYLLEKQLKPEARLDIIGHLAEIKVKPKAMIDVSDGLASEVLHLCNESKLGCKLFEDKLPIDPLTYDTAREFHLDPTLCALSGGEDYELLFTVNQEDFERLKGDPHFSVIGYMCDPEEGHVMTLKNGGETPIVAQGWNAFSNENKGDRE